MRTATVDGAKVRKAREAAGWTQAELGALVGLHHTTISTIESGKSQPSAGSFKLMVRALRVNRDDLLVNGEATCLSS